MSAGESELGQDGPSKEEVMAFTELCAALAIDNKMCKTCHGRGWFMTVSRMVHKQKYETRTVTACGCIQEDLVKYKAWLLAEAAAAESAPDVKAVVLN